MTKEKIIERINWIEGFIAGCQQGAGQAIIPNEIENCILGLEKYVTKDSMSKAETLKVLWADCLNDFIVDIETLMNMGFSREEIDAFAKAQLNDEEKHGRRKRK